MTEAVRTLGILSDDVQEGPVGPSPDFEANMRRWYGISSSTGAVVVGFAGCEGIYEVADEVPTVKGFWWLGPV